MPRLRSAHALVGIVVLVVFIATGAYMRLGLHGLAGMAMGPRMFFRSRHIYILAGALVNLALGAYFTGATAPWRRRLQLAGSALLLLSPLLLVAAFFVEPRLALPETPLSSYGLFSLLGGCLGHALATLNAGPGRAA